MFLSMPSMKHVAKQVDKLIVLSSVMLEYCASEKSIRSILTEKRAEGWRIENSKNKTLPKQGFVFERIDPF